MHHDKINNMKTILKCSLFLNFGLLGSVAFMLCLGQRRTQVPAAPAALAQQPVVTETQVRVSATPAGAEPTHFHWSQLNADDCHLYVQNLRNIGCPEATVRAIVKADVRAVFSQRSEVLRQKMADLTAAPWSARLNTVNDEAAIRGEMEALPNTETAMIADLLGLKSAPAQVAAATGSPLRSQNHASAEAKPVTMPFALMDIDPAALNLTEEQRQAIAELRQNFTEQIGGTNQSPDDPAYLARWQQAQPQADNMLRLTLGNDAFFKYTMLVENQAAAQP